MSQVKRALRIAIIGDRGIPAKYSGFSTLVEELAVGLVADHNYEVTVYCRTRYYEDRPKFYKGVRARYLSSPGGKSFESIIHSNLAILDASLRRFDLVFVVDPGNGPFRLPLRLVRTPVVLHTDGLGWQRRKWSPLQRKYYKYAEKVSAKLATWLVTDSRAMQDYYETEYEALSTYIPYSGEVGDPPDNTILNELGIDAKDFYLVVARMEPENNVDLIIDEYRKSKVDRPLIVVGSTPYQTDYSAKVMAEHDDQVRCIGSIFESAKLNALYAQCRAYIHGHEVGGTNPSLLRAMHHGAACVPINVIFHRQNVGEEAPYFDKEPGSLATILRALDGDDARCILRGEDAHSRERRLFRWDAVNAGYATLFETIIEAKQKGMRLTSREIGETYKPENFILPPK